MRNLPLMVHMGGISLLNVVLIRLKTICFTVIARQKCFYFSLYVGLKFDACMPIFRYGEGIR